MSWLALLICLITSWQAPVSLQFTKFSFGIYPVFIWFLSVAANLMDDDLSFENTICFSESLFSGISGNSVLLNPKKSIKKLVGGWHCGITG